jgi:drug/metabolite transporter, DME family
MSLVMISLAASLWGIIAIFVKELSEIGFTPMEIVAIRVTVALTLLLMIGVSFFPEKLKVRLKDTPIFIGSGIISIVFFNWCYFTTINEMNLSLAVILLYTSPAFVVLLSRLFFKERWNKQKVMALIGTLVGCVLITGIGTKSTADLSMIGLLTGLGSGLGYALYTIFGKIALRRYVPFTVTLYTFMFAAVALIPVTKLWNKSSLLLQSDTLIWAFGLGLFPTVLAYFLYTKGLESVESSKAAIIATVEPLVATILSIVLYKEGMGPLQVIGTGLIFSSIIVVNLTKRKKAQEGKEEIVKA